eukprot:scaffold932_cov328-Pavlova_lutheri.AAC.30
METQGTVVSFRILGLLLARPPPLGVLLVRLLLLLPVPFVSIVPLLPFPLLLIITLLLVGAGVRLHTSLVGHEDGPSSCHPSDGERGRRIHESLQQQGAGMHWNSRSHEGRHAQCGHRGHLPWGIEDFRSHFPADAAHDSGEIRA